MGWGDCAATSSASYASHRRGGQQSVGYSPGAADQVSLRAKRAARRERESERRYAALAMIWLNDCLGSRVHDRPNVCAR